MQTRFFSVLVTCFVVTSVFSQVSLNDYKYIIVSKKYDFLKEADQYQINSFSKFLFNKYGFEALMEGEKYPQDLIQNRCLALKSDLLKDSGMFKTKLSLELKDCNDQVVYTSPTGESREKEFKKSYTEATRNVFKHLELLDYKYEPNENRVAVSTPVSAASNEVTEEIQKLKEEIQTLKEEQKPEVTVIERPKVVVTQLKPIENKQVKEVAVIEGASNVLYAQAIENGFQLVDSSPKVVYRVKDTNLKDVFLVEGNSAIVYKKGDDWIIEYYSGASLEHEVLNIKF